MESQPEKNKKSADLKDGVHLKAYSQHLERRIRDIEVEKRTLDTDVIHLKQNIQNYTRELDSLKGIPQIIGIIIDFIDDNGRALISSSTGAEFIVNVSSDIPKELLKPGTRISMTQHSMAVIDVMPSDYDPFIQGMELSDNIPDISYEDIGGLEDQILEVREAVELPLTKPELFEKIGITPPKGVLLYGPPGTGKTLLAKAVAHETKSTFIKIVGSELVQKYIGEGARYVREVFGLARKKAPSILFIDEIDAVASERTADSTSGDREVERTLMQLLNELDGFTDRGDVKIIAATNRIDILDPAILRPGRFDRLIEIPIPNVQARRDIFNVHMRTLNIEDSVIIENLVRLTDGATGADIKAICTEAGMRAIRRDSESVSSNDFIDAIEKVLLKLIKRNGSSDSKLFV